MDNQDGKCKQLAAYENRRNMPEEARCTEYFDDFETYLFRPEIKEEQKLQRQKEARTIFDDYIENDVFIKAVYEKRLPHNLHDSSRYAMRNMQQLYATYRSETAREKRLGIAIGDRIYFLVRQEQGKAPDLMQLPVDDFLQKPLYIKRLDEIRSEWFAVLQADYEQSIVQAAADEKAEREAASKRKTDRRRILARMEEKKKVFEQERMEGYCFAGMDLSGAVFIGCCLADSDFTDSDLTAAVFIHCDMRNVQLARACSVSGARAYIGGEMVDLYEKKRIYLANGKGA